MSHIKEYRDKTKMRVLGSWLKPRLRLKIIEHVLLALTMLMIPIYIKKDSTVDMKGWMVLIPPSLSAFFNLVLVKYD